MASVSLALRTLVLATFLAAMTTAPQASATKTHVLFWSIGNTTLTKDCTAVTVPTVNGISPGPAIEITEGDTLRVTVKNNQIYPVTVHWHGIKQSGTNYADGPAYITQCPIEEGGSLVYEFTVTGQSGTFWYHAHIAWLRATVHGALIVKPKEKPAYAKGLVIEKEIPIVLGEWIGMDPNVYQQGFLYNVPPLEAIATITPLINGKAGPLYNCSTGPTTFTVKEGKTYLLRIISAVLNNDYHFRVAGHKVKVVGADGNYLKPFKTNLVAITPGQTTDVLVTFSKTPGKYYFGIEVGPVPDAGSPPPSIPALGLFQYDTAPTHATPIVPKFPNNVTEKPLDKYVAKLKGLDKYAISKTVTQDLIYAVNTALAICLPNEPCNIGVKIIAAINNITWVDPVGTSILQAYSSGANGVYSANFPDRPPSLNVSVTTSTPAYAVGSRGTRVKVLKYGDIVQLVLQNVNSGGILDHPFHLHGHDFYVIGRGYGVYDPAKDPKNFNLVDPPLYSTFGVPNAGWLAIRFHANNPGVWLMHCHFERHKSWGMSMVFITRNGGGLSLKAPLHPLPKC